MAISLVFTDTWNIAGGSSDITHNFSGAVLEGDYVHISLASDNSMFTDGGIATAGYTEMWRPNIAAPGMLFAIKKMGATPDTSVDISQVAAKRTACMINVFRGVDPTSFTDNGWGQVSAGSTTRLNPPSREILTDNAWNFCLGFLDDDETSSSVITTFTNYAESGAGAAANAGASIFSCTRLQTTAGVFDPQAFGTHSSDAGRAVHITIKPAVGDPDNEAVLSVTEAADTAALVGDVEIDAVLGASEAQDMAAMAGDVENDAVFAATEANDILAFVVGVLVDASFIVTEAIDVAVMVAENDVDASFVTTEAIDVMALVGDVPITGVFITTEAADILAVVVDVPIDASFVATEAIDVLAFIGTVTDASQDAVLDATEATDLLSFNLQDSSSLRFDGDRPLTRTLTTSLVGPRQHL